MSNAWKAGAKRSKREWRGWAALIKERLADIRSGAKEVVSAADLDGNEEDVLEAYAKVDRQIAKLMGSLAQLVDDYVVMGPEV